jgi:hypothetical protein
LLESVYQAHVGDVKKAGGVSDITLLVVWKNLSQFTQENRKTKKFTAMFGSHKKLPPFPTLSHIITDNVPHPVPLVEVPFQFISHLCPAPAYSQRPSIRVSPSL